jgi:hypothetical protein
MRTLESGHCLCHLSHSHMAPSHSHMPREQRRATSHLSTTTAPAPHHSLRIRAPDPILSSPPSWWCCWSCPHLVPPIIVTSSSLATPASLPPLPNRLASRAGRSSFPPGRPLCTSSPPWACTLRLCPSAGSSLTASGWSRSRASAFPLSIPPRKKVLVLVLSSLQSN